MPAEALEAPNTVARLRARDEADCSRFGAWLRGHSPNALPTVARGSSDHAAH